MTISRPRGSTDNAPSTTRFSSEDRTTVAALETRSRPAVGRYVFAVIAILAVVAFLLSLVANDALDWPTVWRYLFNPRILSGVLVTIEMTALALLLGFSSGLLLAAMRLSRSRILQIIAIVWVWFFRAVPVLVILIVINNVALLYPQFGIGIPFGPMIIGFDTKQFVTPFFAAVIAFGANEGAYSSEIFRASISSVSRGQSEAALALGMTGWRASTRIVLPQAMRFAVPPLANNAINMLKGTSIVSYIGVADLLYTAQSIYAQNFAIIPLLIVACLWYLVLVSILTWVQSLIERRLTGRSTARRRAVRAVELEQERNV
jgi:polar amino acid transport system permease protein